MTLSTILKAFDGHTFHPYVIISTFPIDLGEEIVSIEVEIVVAPIYYNLFLGSHWFYEMKVVMYSLFHVMHFPHQGKVIIIDQLNYCTPNLRANANTNVSFVSDSPRGYDSVMVGLFKDSSLLDTFPLTPLDISQVDPINMIYFVGHSSSAYDLWAIPNPS